MKKRQNKKKTKSEALQQLKLIDEATKMFAAETEQKKKQW